MESYGIFSLVSASFPQHYVCQLLCVSVVHSLSLLYSIPLCETSIYLSLLLVMAIVAIMNSATKKVLAHSFW